MSRSRSVGSFVIIDIQFIVGVSGHSFKRRQRWSQRRAVASWIHNISHLLLQVMSIFTVRGSISLHLLKSMTEFLFSIFFFLVNYDGSRKTRVGQKVATSPLFVLDKMVLLVNFDIGIRVLFVCQNITQIVFHLSQLLLILGSLASSTFGTFRCCGSSLRFRGCNLSGESLKGEITFFVRTFFNFANVCLSNHTVNYFWANLLIDVFSRWESRLFNLNFFRLLFHNYFVIGFIDSYLLLVLVLVISNWLNASIAAEQRVVTFLSGYTFEKVLMIIAIQKQFFLISHSWIFNKCFLHFNFLIQMNLLLLPLDIC